MAMIKKNRIAAESARIIEPVLEENGFELVDAEYLSQGGRWVLRILADRDGGITVDECASLSREIGDLLDVRDLIPHEYVLEVSSPGLNRPLCKERHVMAALGKKVEVKMAVPVHGQKKFRGCLKDFKDGVLHVEVDDRIIPLPWPDVEKANQLYEFGN